MYYFLLGPTVLPSKFCSVLAADFNKRRGESPSLSTMLEITGHLIPDDVEILEYDASVMKVAVPTCGTRVHWSP